MSTTSTDIDDVRRQMAMIRRELHEDVKGVVATANAATNWRRYLTSYPLVSLGVAATIGYLIVPRKTKTAEVIPLSTFARIQEAAQTLKSGKASHVVPPADPKQPSVAKSVVSAGLGMLTPLVLRAAQGYAIQYFEQWLAQQQEQALRTPPVSTGPTTPRASSVTPGAKSS